MIDRNVIRVLERLYAWTAYRLNAFTKNMLQIKESMAEPYLCVKEVGMPALS